MGRYQSTEMTATKQKLTDYSPKPVNRDYKYGNYYNSSTNIYTPEKPLEKDNNHEEVLNKYNTYSKSSYNRQSGPYKTTSDKIINIDVTPEKKIREEYRTTAPKEPIVNSGEKSQVIENSNRNGYFESMNKELSEKIDEIRKKYDKEREKLYSKYQSSTPKKD